MSIIHVVYPRVKSRKTQLILVVMIVLVKESSDIVHGEHTMKFRRTRVENEIGDYSEGQGTSSFDCHRTEDGVRRDYNDVLYLVNRKYAHVGSSQPQPL